MRKIFALYFISALLGNRSFAQNVGIGTTNPLARLHVTDSNVIFSAPGAFTDPPSFSLPIEGPGSRLMWIPQKGAFRVGAVGGAGDQWNANKIGLLSFAAGINSEASGTYSVAFGGSRATGWGTTAFGDVNEASGYKSTVMGIGSKTTGDACFGLGLSLSVRTAQSFAIGRFNDSVATSNSLGWIPEDPLFIMGNGSADNARHNAMVVYKNGNMVLKNPTTVFTDPTGYTIPVSGAGTRMMWLPEKAAFRVGTTAGSSWNASNIGLGSFAAGYNNTASGENSTAMGNSTTASGIYSFSIGSSSVASGGSSVALGVLSTASGPNSTAMGRGTEASGTYSTAIGSSTTASGTISVAMGLGTTASGNTATSIGNNTIALGDVSATMGIETIASAYASVSMGRFNDNINTSATNAWVATDPLLILGNGTSNIARSNALVVYKNGNTDINGYTQLGKSTEGAPSIKMKKIIGYNTPTSANPNTWTFVPHGLNASKILAISVLVTLPGGFDILPHSPDAGVIYTVNTDPSGGGVGPSIAIGVKSVAQSSSVMGKPVKILITYEE